MRRRVNKCKAKRKDFDMLEVIAGPMQGGKTWLLGKRVSDAILMGKKVQVFAYPVYEGQIVSLTGFVSNACTVDTVEKIESNLDPEVEMIAIDDAQLFDKKALLAFCDKWRRHIDIVVAGVQLNCFGEDFGAVVELMGKAEQVTVLLAVCGKCKKQTAILTQRYKDIEHTTPITKDDPRIELRKEFYAPACWHCYEPPR